MKPKLPLILILCFFILLACQSTETLPTEVITVEVATATSAPPTDTPEPTITPITYPDVLDQTFSNVNILSKDDFEYKFQGMVPNGWTSADGNAVLRITKDDNVKITPLANSVGGIFYFQEKAITPGEGVSFIFQYTGTRNNFTWGLDNINAQDEFFEFKRDGYYSFAMQMLDKSLSAHVIEGPYLKDDPFNGNLKLLEGVWYNYTIAFDKENNYIIKIWESNSPENQLSYVRHWENSPTAYYFISWIGAERELWIDDFTIFSFDTIIP